MRPICLPLTDDLRTKDLVGYYPFIAGWGKTTENGEDSVILQELQLPILNNTKCKECYRNIGKLIDEENQFSDVILCAGILNGGHDSCQGDSGGPLMLPIRNGKMTNFYQIGVVAYGVGCGRADVPGAYTNVQKFTDWIIETIKE